jgi:dTDP-4-amino-4,6-dideoxygalactose transaminase
MSCTRDERDDGVSQFKDLVGVRHAVTVNSGTAALHIVLRTQALKHGDEVIVPTNDSELQQPLDP